MAGVDFVDFGQKSSVHDGRAGRRGAIRRTARAWGLRHFGREAAGGYID